jgi:hypothetical protein
VSERERERRKEYKGEGQGQTGETQIGNIGKKIAATPFTC